MGFFDSVSFTAHGVSPWETSELREVFPHGVRLGMYAKVLLRMIPTQGVTEVKVTNLEFSY